MNTASSLISSVPTPAPSEAASISSPTPTSVPPPVSPQSPSIPSASPHTQPLPDDETLARAVLTVAVNSADALMFAMLKGADSAVAVADMLLDAARHDGGDPALRRESDRIFATGIARWGRKVRPEGMKAFHASWDRWIHHLRRLPSCSMHALRAPLTDGGRMWIIAPHSAYWPHQVDDLSIQKDWSPPLCLWGLGDPAALTCCQQPLAIVGSRAADDYGCTVARDIASEAASAGHLVVSGGAMGIDAAAHQGALSAAPSGGRTVAVFAGGLHHIGPQRNQRLFERMLRQGGALISELPPDIIPEGHRFLLRNRIIAALASSVVVAQARPRSGALNTAGWACDLNRLLYAVPGAVTSPHNAGCNTLIHENKAVIITSPHCIDEICHAAHPKPDIGEPAAVPDPCTNVGACARPDTGTGTGTGTDNGTNTGTGTSAGVPPYRSIPAAIAACRRARTPPNADAILAVLQRSGVTLSIEALLAELTRLELEGVIVRTRDGYAVPAS